MGQYYKALVRFDDGSRHSFSPQSSAYRAKYGDDAYDRLYEEHHRRNPDGSTTFVPYPDEYHRLSQGLKLMEHAWFCRPFVVGVLNVIRDRSARVAWVGDYACENEDYARIAEFSSEDYEACWNYDEEPTEAFPEVPDGSVKGYLVNLDKGIYLDLAEIAMAESMEDSHGVGTHPLPILTAIGNGRGGGDYYGSNMEQVGSWAMDRLQFVLDEPEDMGRGEPEEYMFVERW